MDKTNNTVQAFWVLVGSLSAFAFTIVSSMILSRYFDKQDYGTYKQVMYVYTSLLVVFTLGLPKAYSFFLPRVPKSEAKSLINKINFILIGSGLLMSAMLFLGSDLIAVLLKNEELALLLKYFSLVPFFMLPTMGLEGILATYKKTKLIAIYTITTRALMLLCVTLPVIFFNGDVSSAIIGFSLASFLSFLMAIYLKYYPLKNEEKLATKIQYKEILNYTLPIMFASIWGIIFISADQFFISRYFGTEVFADFANGSLKIPFISMIVGASATILTPIISGQVFENGVDANNTIITLWRSVFVKTVKIIYPIIIFFIFFADIIMILMFGEIYASSGSFFRIKIFANFFTVITYWPILLSIGGNKFYYKVHMYAALSVILLEWISVYTIKSPYAIVVISVVCQIVKIFAILNYITSYFKIKITDVFPLKLIAELLIPSIIILFFIRFLLTGMDSLNPAILLIVGLFIYVLVFGLWVYLRKIEYYSILKPLINKFFKRK